MNAEATNPTLAPSPLADWIVTRIDMTSDFFGKAVSYFILPMIYVLLHEVISRYFFNAPTIWAGDMALILYGIYYMVGSPYCLKEGMHIRTDFLYAHWSVKTRGMVDFIIYVGPYTVTHLIFLWIGWKYFWKSFVQNEMIISSPWMPIIWPMKFAIPLSLFLMLLQGFSQIIKSWYMWRHGEYHWGNPEHGADEEIAAACAVKEEDI